MSPLKLSSHWCVFHNRSIRLLGMALGLQVIPNSVSGGRARNGACNKHFRPSEQLAPGRVPSRAVYVGQRCQLPRTHGPWMQALGSVAEVALLPGFLSSHLRAEGPVLYEFTNPEDEACLSRACLSLFLVISDALAQCRQPVVCGHWWSVRSAKGW